MARNLAFFLVTAIALLLLEGTTRARVVFMDRFEYAVGRSDPNAANVFVQNGWSHAKTQQNSSGAHGWLHTVTSIPGYSGPFPGTNSTRVLALEARPRAFAPVGGDIYQTDFYLQLGDGSSSASDDYIPGDVWFQFWLYPQNSGSEISTYGTRNKFLYVCNTNYPCHSHLWMMSHGSPTYNSNNMFPLGHPSRGEFFWNVSSASGASSLIKSYDSDNPDQIGPGNTSEWMRPNRWTLVRMRFNTTATTGNSWEMWLRPYGGAWTKVSEWIGGRTPGFTWNIPSASVGGHRVLRMPTTVNDDYWMYMDDFVMATSADDLPAYADERPGGGITAPGSPANLRIIRTALLDGTLFRSPATFLAQGGLLP